MIEAIECRQLLGLSTYVSVVVGIENGRMGG